MAKHLKYTPLVLNDYLGERIGYTFTFKTQKQNITKGTLKKQRKKEVMVPCELTKKRVSRIMQSTSENTSKRLNNT